MVRRLVPLLPAIVALLALGAVSLTSIPELSSAAKGIGIGCAVASMLAAVFPRRPDLRAHGSVALAAGAMVAAGQVGHDATFMVFTAPFLAAAVATLRAPRVAETLARKRGAGEAQSLFDRAIPVRSRTPVLLAIVSGALVASLLVASLPPASRVVEAQVDRFFTGQIEDNQRIGFSSRLKLGSTTNMLTSGRVVLHVAGTAPELLRGAVYDRYEGEVWTSTRDTERKPVDATMPPASTARILIARGSRLPRGRQARFFVPPGTCRFGTASKTAAADGFGILRPSRQDDLAAELVVLSESDARASGWSCEPGLAAPPPGDQDLDMPASLRQQLAPIALEWLEGHVDLPARETVQLYAKRLMSFGYSLAVKRNHRIDPVVDLLTLHKEGHCEMFAAALALLARTQGIPARVVTGYRVSETNPLTGVSVVRERNAHAWVEVWLDGHWTAVDPTPPAELAGKPRPTWTEHVWDALGTEIDRFWAAVVRADPVTLGLGFVALGIAYLSVRRALAALRRRAPRSAEVAQEALASYDELEASLARAGLERKPSEPIERFATRIAEGGEAWAGDAASAIRRYAALRYGSEGSERDVARELSELAQRI